MWASPPGGIEPIKTRAGSRAATHSSSSPINVMGAVSSASSGRARATSRASPGRHRRMRLGRGSRRSRSGAGQRRLAAPAAECSVKAAVAARKTVRPRPGRFRGSPPRHGPGQPAVMSPRTDSPCGRRAGKSMTSNICLGGSVFNARGSVPRPRPGLAPATAGRS